MDFTQMRDFIAVVEAGSLTRAAVALGVSQPSVSHRMSRLEAELGVRLLERGPRGVIPTQAGLALYRGSHPLLREVTDLASSVAGGGQGLRGPVSVGLPSTVSHLLTPPLFALVRERHPGIRLQLFESMSGYVEELLGLGRLDLATLFRTDATARPDEVPLYSERLYLVGRADPADHRAGRRAGHRDGEPVGVPELAGVPLIAPGPRSNLRALIERAFAGHELAPTIVGEVESLSAMVRIAEGGQAWAVLPRSSVDLDAHPGLTLRPIVDPVVARRISLCMATEFHQPRAAVSAVRDCVIETVDTLLRQKAWPGANREETPPA